MIGLGTVINTAAIVVGGLVGHFCGKLLKERHRETLNVACGVSVLFLGIAGAMEYMLTVEDARLVSGHAMLLVGCLALGYLSLVGSVLIFCVGVNLVWGKKVRVANLLPAVFLAIAAAYLGL